jgi:hypothetical protein
MRAIIIDPFKRSVMETDIDGSAGSICEALGCDVLEIAHQFETGDTLYVDESGLSRAQDALNGSEDGERAYAFDVGAHQPFLGKGVILGPEDQTGRHTDAVMPTSRLFSTVFLIPAAAKATGIGLPPH